MNMVSSFLAALARSTPEVPPGLRPVSGETLASLAREHLLSLRETELAALAAGLVPSRYLRNMTTYGPEAQARLLEARVALAGLGGLGGKRGLAGRTENRAGDRCPGGLEEHAASEWLLKHGVSPEQGGESWQRANCDAIHA